MHPVRIYPRQVLSTGFADRFRNWLVNTAVGFTSYLIRGDP
jgi:hypothetical protein